MCPKASSTALPEAAQPVVVGGVTFHVAGRRDRGGLSFWIERPQGKLWRHINQPATHGRSVASEREIVALTSEDPAMRQVALASGWFEPTGRTLRYPYDDSNEVWALSTQGLEAFGSSPGTIQPELESLSPKLCAFLGIWVKGALAHMQVIGAAVLGPAPKSSSTDERVLLGVYPDRLTDVARLFKISAGSPRRLVQSFELGPGAEGWQRAAVALGFKTALQVSLPAVAGRTFDCLMVGVQASQFAAVAAATLNAWPDMKAALLADSPLTPRELACLQYTAEGYTAEECAQLIGCSESNVRHHLSKAMRRLGAPNTVSTIQRAQLMGLLL